MAELSDAKLPLPSFLKILTSNNVPASKAMAVTGKIYKTCNTPALLAELTDLKLKDIGVDDKEDRKLVLAAIHKAGYKPGLISSQRSSATRNTSADAGPSPRHSQPDMSNRRDAAPSQGSQRTKSKRKRDQDRNEFLPDRPREELEEQAYGSLDFSEVVDEETLKPKLVVINRAPIMTAWSFVVAEQLGFQREEALSIASVYTEMNAISKGVAIGIYDEGKQKGVEASKGGTQPYVDLMGRSPLYQTVETTWRALSSGTPVAPASAFSYITRSLKQTAPFIVGAMRLLAESYSPEDLNKLGFSLYTEFRPEVNEWGGRGEVRCETILSLRRVASTGSSSQRDEGRPQGMIKVEHHDNAAHEEIGEQDQQLAKKARVATNMTLEEYEAALDADDMFAKVDSNFPYLPDTKDI